MNANEIAVAEDVRRWRAEGSWVDHGRWIWNNGRLEYSRQPGWRLPANAGCSARETAGMVPTPELHVVASSRW
ncbi:MAG: hypothetical protein KKE86_16440 [Planctomycetes bacterium]|nr:hypothetical protein [Planctomycetota bacterium]MBU4400905.1 hypothetical protein [Planctomycetota bacterium]MCG2684784.1 hypothetical protein [Planctomycetales bacterium]